MPHGLPAKPIAAAFIPEEVAPTTGPGLAAVGIASPGGRAGTRNDRHSRAGTSGREQQAGVVDHGDLGSRDEGLDQPGQGGGVIVGVDSPGPRVHPRHGARSDPGKKVRQVAGRFLTGDVLYV